MQLEKDSLALLAEALQEFEQGFAGLPDCESELDLQMLRDVLLKTARKLQDNYPYFHPLYVGQMLKPPHPVARLAYMLSLWINPNNHALDGGRASSQMEKEAVAELATMFGWDEHLGHLTSGGTMANLEALWVAGQLQPGKKILASSQAHYTHERISSVLRLEFESVQTDNYGRLDLNRLEERVKRGDIGAVVATLGTTSVGAVDPLPDIITLRERYGFRVHVDAAYGGYFILAGNLGAHARGAFDAVSQVDSIVIDPHKHGLQPYGCGCVLFRDPKVGGFYKHESPYTYFSSDELHLGEISLECSRPGAAAVALWTTQQLLPLNKTGRLAGDLGKSLAAARKLFDELHADEQFMTFLPPELDIVAYSAAGESVTALSARNQAVFDRAAKNDLHLAVSRLPADLLRPWQSQLAWDADSMSVLRSCLMKPEHADWIPEILARLRRSLQ